MKNLDFRLQKVLDIKMRDEEASKVRYIEVENNKKVVEIELDRLKNNYNKYSNINDISDVLTQKITANYLSSLSYTIDKTENDLEKKKSEANIAREDLISKQVARKSLEKLKENKLKTLKRESEQKEQIINDEYALYSYMRQRVQLDYKVN